MESQGSTDSEEREQQSSSTTGRNRANSFSKKETIPLPIIAEEKTDAVSSSGDKTESKEVRKDLNERELKALRKVQ
jgi:hypothetical protein